MHEPIHDICAWERRGTLERIEAALGEENPHPKRIYLRINPAGIESQGCSSTPNVTRLSEAEQGDIAALASRLLRASKAVELVVVWCGDEPLCALDVIRNITNALRTVAAEHGSGIRATVVTGGELLDRRAAALLESCRVKRVRVAVTGPGDVFDKVMDNLRTPHRFVVEVCMKTNAENAEAAGLVRKRVEEVALESGNLLVFVDGDALEGCADENCADGVMTLEELGQVAVPILKRWGVARAWVFGSFAHGWANERSDIDMMAEMPPDVHLGYRYFDLRRELKEALGRKVELHLPPYKPNGDPFLNVMEQTRVLIYGDA